MFFCIDCQEHSTNKEIESQQALCFCGSDNIMEVPWNHFVGYKWIDDNPEEGFNHPDIFGLKYCACEDYPCCGHN